MIWFCSDLHLGHKRAALEFRKERNYSNVEEHDQDIINILNSHIKPNDTVWHLGDFVWDTRKYGFNDLMKGLNGNWNFIYGNHKDYDYLPNVNKHHFKELKISEHIHITMCHYPLISWNHSHYGSISLHGHHHSNIIAEKFPGKRLNVCWEVIGYRPIELEEVKEIISKLENWDYIVT